MVAGCKDTDKGQDSGVGIFESVGVSKLGRTIKVRVDNRAKRGYIWSQAWMDGPRGTHSLCRRAAGTARVLLCMHTLAAVNVDVPKSLGVT